MSGRPTADIVADLRMKSIVTILSQPGRTALAQFVEDAAERLVELEAEVDRLRDELGYAGLPLPICPTCHDERCIERLATPDEVDNGCELGVTYDPCPDCTDGRMSFEWMLALVNAVFDADNDPLSSTLHSHQSFVDGFNNLIRRLRNVRP